MSDIAGTVERYLSLWNETDAAARKEGIAEVFADGATYTDPLADVTGPDGIDAVMAAAQAQFAGFTFRLLTAVDSNHHIARFSWELVPAAGGESVVIGSDTAVFAEDGRIRSVYGFLDKVPAA
jgi:SnoaL-like domain